MILNSRVGQLVLFKEFTFKKNRTVYGVAVVLRVKVGMDFLDNLTVLMKDGTVVTRSALWFESL